MSYADIDRAVRRTGMFCRGGFHPAPGDDLDGTATVILVGNAGPAFWQSAAPNLPETRHPLDDWTRAILTPIAEECGAQIAFPFDGPPYHPFQQWAQRSEPVFPAPIGPLIHPEFGLWHAYRAAFLLSARIELPARGGAASPCDSCADRPCLATCPVGAFGAAGYDVPKCVDHIERPEGADCLELGCRARRACPVGADFLYPPGQARHHMAAFIAAQRIATRKA